MLPAVFGLGVWEIALLLAVALLVFGPTKLPELARSLGKGLKEFRKATEDFKATIDEEVRRPDPPKAQLQAKAAATDTDVTDAPAKEAHEVSDSDPGPVHTADASEPPPKAPAPEPPQEAVVARGASPADEVVPPSAPVESKTNA